MALRVGIIPEHFSTPIQFARIHKFFEQNGVEVELIDYPSGSGHLISSLKNDEIDIAIGLTEAFVRGLCDGDDEHYRISGTYVESPLCWAISTGINRDELTSYKQLAGKRISVSRIGSGSYVMSFVLALQENFSKPFYSDFPIMNNFKNLRDSVNLKEGLEGSEAFMWEHFTSKKYYDTKEIKKIGEIYTPWSSWVIVSQKKILSETMKKFNKSIQQGIEYYLSHLTEASEYIAENLDYTLEDAKEWQKTVKFAQDVNSIDFEKNILNTKNVLKTAGVIQKDETVDTDEVVLQRLQNGTSQ